MRILVLGAGAIGGYYGGRLLEAGAADIGFLVRPGRKAQLERDGLVIESRWPGNFTHRPVRTLLAEQVRADEPGWDLVLLTCKAYDLDAAIDAIRPAVGESTAVLPLLNGMSHLDRLQEEFGSGRVLGGLAAISVTLGADGGIRHLAPMQHIAFGELDGSMSARVEALRAAFARTPIKTEATGKIIDAMWEKLVVLGSLAAATVLMRANIGEIGRAPGGEAWLLRLLERSAAAASGNGHPVRASVVNDTMGAAFRDPNSALTASMLRDLEAGGPIEADHILGFLLDAVRRAGVPDGMHEAAYLHAKAYENRRLAGRLASRQG
jgi:2-dehydropantoate 2-reductase